MTIYCAVISLAYCGQAAKEILYYLKATIVEFSKFGTKDILVSANNNLVQVTWYWSLVIIKLKLSYLMHTIGLWLTIDKIDMFSLLGMCDISEMSCHHCLEYS